MFKKLFVLGGSVLIPISFAYSQMDEGNRSLLIDKLETVYQHLAPKDSSKVAVTLRLADLYAERARTEALKELEQGCSVCNAGGADRKKALRLYTEVLDRAPEAVQGKVMVQVGHLYQLTGDEAKAIGFYNKILQQTASAELKAEAQLSLAELYFKRRDFTQAQGFYLEVLNNPAAASRGLAAYRASWCAFNLGQIDSAVLQMEKILKTPNLLTRSGSAQTQADPQFHEEVSRDFATFLSKKNIENKDIEVLFKLSPENVRVQNVKSLALDLERIGKKSESLKVWEFAFAHMSQPEDRLAAQISMAQLNFDLNDSKAGAARFESAMNLWKDLKGCESNACDELRRRSRQFVVSWNQIEKKAPTAELLAAYELFLQNFPQDVEMNVYAATIAKDLKNWEASWLHYNSARAWYLNETQGKTADVLLADKLENSLVALLDVAEASKDEKKILQAYEFYLGQSLKKTKSFEVQYQKAHRLYEKGQYAEASQQLRQLALNSQGDAKIRKQAADLSLDALVLMKDESQIALWAAEYAQVLVTGAQEFQQIVQKAALTKSAQLAATSAEAAYAELINFNPSQASAEDRIKFYKNKLILAEKLNKYSEAQMAADSLLQETALTSEDREFAWARKAYMAEMTLDFTTALLATEKVQSSLKPDEKILKMALFAELAGQKSSPYYSQYLQASKDEENKKLVAAELVRKSKLPEKELELYRPILGKSPQLMARLYTEVFAKSSNESILKKVSKDPALRMTDSGKLLTRVAFLKDFEGLKKALVSHQLETKNDRKLAASMKARVALLERLESAAKKAIDSADWTSQLVTVDLLAKESERFYNEILSAPMPQGLSDEEQQQYMHLLSAQATPFQAKSTEAKNKVEQFWKNPGWQAALKSSWEQVELRSLILSEVSALREIAPPEQQGVFAQLVNTQGEKSLTASRPSLKDLQEARHLVQKNPFDKQALQALLDLEKKADNTAMTQYLQTRLENLAKSSEKGVL